MKLMQNSMLIIFCLITVFSGVPLDSGAHEKIGHLSNKTSDDLSFLDKEKGILGFTLDRTTINEIQNRLGNAEIIKGGKHEPNRFCYVSSNAQDSTVLEIESDILGDKDIFSGFALYSIKPKHLLNNNCLPSPLVQKNITTLDSIRLGLALTSVKVILGNPTHEKKNTIIYSHEYRVPWPDQWYTGNNRPVPKEKDYYDVYIDIWGEFENGRLVVIKISEHSSL